MLGAAAAAGYVLLAVYAVQLVVTETGQPSLGHAGFMAIGAYLMAFLRLRLGLDGLSAALLAALAAGAAGWVMGVFAARLPGPAVALLTWAFGWMVFVALEAFSQFTGGTSGVAMHGPLRMRVDVLGIDLAFSEAGHLLLGLLLLGLFLIAYRAAQRSVIGRSWTAVRGNPALAASLGVDVGAVRRWAFAVSAAVVALAAGLLAQLLTIVDPTLFSPVQSLVLYAAVLAGAPLGFFGPVAGAAVVAGIPYAIDGFAASAGMARGTARQLASGMLILGALAVAAWLDRRHPREDAVRPAAGGVPQQPRDRGPGAAAGLEATGITMRFGGVVAVDAVDLRVGGGEIHGVIGPNGSGKSTLLRCLSGALVASAGAVAVGGRRLDGLPEHARARAGLVRAFQRTAVIPRLAVAEHVRLGAQVHQPNARWAQALFRTPRYRAGVAEAAAVAEQAMAAFGLGGYRDAHAIGLSSGRQRLLQVATAAAAEPRVVLLDEPSAGMSLDELAQLQRGLRGLADEGLAVVVVEHNLRFLAGVANTVTVMDGGRAVVTGTPDEVATDVSVRRAYLGDRYADLASAATRPSRRPRSQRPAG